MANDAIEVEGTVTEVLPNANFRVELENGPQDPNLSVRKDEEVLHPCP